jgi:hypothetical protein
MSKPLNDLFRRYGIPPSPLHWAVQEAARQEGWTPPWDREEQQSQKKMAGHKSGFMRAGRAGIRRHFIKTAFERLPLELRIQATSANSIDALMAEYRKLLAEGGFDPDLLMSTAPFKASRETLKKDLKLLDIHNRHPTQRSG